MGFICAKLAIIVDSHNRFTSANLICISRLFYLYEPYKIIYYQDFNDGMELMAACLRESLARKFEGRGI